MVTKRIKEIADSIKTFLKNRNIKIERIILFGSYAKGNPRIGSDLDIAIVSSDFNGKDIFRKAEMLKGLKWFLAEKFEFAFDIIPVSLKDWKGSSSLSVEFIKEGKTLVRTKVA